MSGVVAWRTGPRTYSEWHITDDDPWVTRCRTAVPQRPLTNVSRVRGKDKSPTCRKCLAVVDKLGSLKQETR